MGFIPTDEQWSKMKQHIKSDNYKKEDFFVFETLAVGDKIVPNRYTKLTKELLEVMMQDAKKGVSFMLNHNWSQMGVQSIPIGKVFDARMSYSSQSGEENTLYTTQYMLRDDSKVDGYSKNDIIKLIETGVMSDTSIGWGTDRDSYKCSICGNSIYDYSKCKHYPGGKYIVNENTAEEKVEQCIILAVPPKELHVGNNVLMENSIVFDGAYPNAVVQSKTECVETKEGLYKKIEDKQNLSQTDVIYGYAINNGINLLYKEVEEGGNNMLKKQKFENQEEEENIPNDATENDEANEANEANEVNESNENDEANEEETLFTEKQLVEKLDNKVKSLDEILEFAKEGIEYKNKVIENALDNGVRSMGNAFSKEVFKSTFENLKIKDILEMSKVWEEQSNEKFHTEKISKQTFDNEEYKHDNTKLSQFKTGNY